VPRNAVRTAVSQPSRRIADAGNTAILPHGMLIRFVWEDMEKHGISKMCLRTKTTTKLSWEELPGRDMHDCILKAAASLERGVNSCLRKRNEGKHITALDAKKSTRKTPPPSSWETSRDSVSIFCRFFRLRQCRNLSCFAKTLHANRLLCFIFIWEKGPCRFSHPSSGAKAVPT
jgi:hypothetical protein